MLLHLCQPHRYGEDNIQCTILSSNDTIKDLGVLTDNNLKFHAHTASVISKANRSLAIKELHTTNPLQDNIISETSD